MQATLASVRRHAGMGLLGLLFLAPVVSLPFVGEHGLLLPVLSVLLLTLLAAQSKWAPQGVRQFFANGTHSAVLAFVAWAAISTLANKPQGFGAQLALQEFVKLAAGAGLYFAVVYQFGTRERLGILAHLMLAGGILAAVAGVSSYVATKDATGAFGNHQILAGFLVALFPVALAFAARGEMRARRILAMVSLVSISGALMLTGNRISWIAALVSAVAVGALALSDSRIRESVFQRRALVAPLVVAALVAGLFFEFSGNRFSNNGIAVLSRLGSVQKLAADTSVQNRVDLLKVAGQMAAAQPVTGGGLGSMHLRASQLDTQFTTPANYELGGSVGMQTMAHNEYAQVTAELGFVGVALYLAVLAAFFVRGVRALGRIQGENRRWLLIAALGSMVAFSVDAIANPAWRFGEVSALFWMVLGLGVAVTRSHSERAVEPVAARTGFAFARPGIALAAAVLAVGMSSLSMAAGVFTGKGVSVIAAYEVGSLQFPSVVTLNNIKRNRNVRRAAAFVVKNVSDVPRAVRLAITGDLDWRMNGARNALVTVLSFNLAPGQSNAVALSFLPKDAGANVARMSVSSDNLELAVINLNANVRP